MTPAVKKAPFTRINPDPVENVAYSWDPKDRIYPSGIYLQGAATLGEADKVYINTTFPALEFVMSGIPPEPTAYEKYVASRMIFDYSFGGDDGLKDRRGQRPDLTLSGMATHTPTTLEYPVYSATSSATTSILTAQLGWGFTFIIGFRLPPGSAEAYNVCEIDVPGIGVVKLKRPSNDTLVFDYGSGSYTSLPATSIDGSSDGQWHIVILSFQNILAGSVYVANGYVDGVSQFYALPTRVSSGGSSPTSTCRLTTSNNTAKVEYSCWKMMMGCVTEREAKWITAEVQKEMGLKGQTIPGGPVANTPFGKDRLYYVTKEGGVGKAFVIDEEDTFVHIRDYSYTEYPKFVFVNPDRDSLYISDNEESTVIVELNSSGETTVQSLYYGLQPSYNPYLKGITYGSAGWGSKALDFLVYNVSNPTALYTFRMVTEGYGAGGPYGAFLQTASGVLHYSVQEGSSARFWRKTYDFQRNLYTDNLTIFSTGNQGANQSQYSPRYDRVYETGTNTGSSNSKKLIEYDPNTKTSTVIFDGTSVYPFTLRSVVRRGKYFYCTYNADADNPSYPAGVVKIPVDNPSSFTRLRTQTIDSIGGLSIGPKLTFVP